MTAAVAPIARTWRLRGRVLDLDRPRLMGVLNVTPDSFSDGGRHADPDDAVRAAEAMVAAGADLLDVGGESTRPGAARVAAAEQIDRIAPVIERIARSVDVAITVDTTRAAVAEAALDLGAHAVNDVSGATEDPAILEVTARAGAGIALMHRLRPPDEDAYSDRYDEPPVYDDPMAAVIAVLTAQRTRARAAGIPDDAIAFDPGLGFGKSVADNLVLSRRLGTLAACGQPVLTGASRKSFVGAVTGVEHPRDRLAGSLAWAVLLAQAGAHILRVHDVGPHREALAVLDGWRDAAEQPAD